MVKNSWRVFLALSLTVGLPVAGSGCDDRKASGPEPLQGVVEYDDRTIGFELGGRVLSVEVERGATVQKDAVLVRLDATLETPLEALRVAELESAKAQLALLEAGARIEDVRVAEAELGSLRAREGIVAKDLQRQRGLLAQSAVPANVVDNLEAELAGTAERRRALEERVKLIKRGARAEEIAAARAHVQAAAAALDAQRTRLSRYVLYSPVDGHALDVHVKVGEMVAPGAPALTLADLSHPYVDIFVPEARMAQVRMGQRVRVQVDGMPQGLPGAVEHVYTRTEFTPRYLFSQTERPNLVVRVRVRIDDPQHALHAGIPAFVTPEGGAPAGAPAGPAAPGLAAPPGDAPATPAAPVAPAAPATEAAQPLPAGSRT
jgi:HlyD family secretion protein